MRLISCHISQVAGEIFRAATKLYYDYYNNALVNNTSGAINYLAKAGVLPTTKPQSDNNDGVIFGTIYPYTIGAKINLGELDILYAIETMMDRTLVFLREHPKLEITPNTGALRVDYHNFRDRDEKVCMERCAIRNKMAAEMNADAKKWAKDMESKAKKAQDHVAAPGSAPSSSKKKNRSRNKKKSDKSWIKPKSKDMNLAAKLSKIRLFD